MQLDAAGWAATDQVLATLARQRLSTSLPELEALVAGSDKQRFELSPGSERIRARQGHSVAVTGDWPISPPPEFLFHGTTERFLGSILANGLRPGARHHVHLWMTVEAARTVGARRGRPAVLEVAAESMTKAGFTFRLSSNGVWLADHVPPKYLRRLD